MSSLLEWLDGSFMYLVAVTGAGALCFVAMRMLA